MLRSAQDGFLKKCKRKTELINQEDLWVDGAFLSEADMLDAGIKEFFDSKRYHIYR